MKYLRIELIDDGSSTYIGDFRISKSLAEKLSTLEADHPKSLKTLFITLINILAKRNKLVDEKRKLK